MKSGNMSVTKSEQVFPRRGDVYFVNLDPTVGSEINKTRPAVIVQNDQGNQHSRTTIIAPIFSIKESSRAMPIFVILRHGEAGMEVDSYINCGQIRTVDIGARLVRKIGVLSPTRMQEVDQALKISLGIK